MIVASSITEEQTVLPDGDALQNPLRLSLINGPLIGFVWLLRRESVDVDPVLHCRVSLEISTPSLFSFDGHACGSNVLPSSVSSN
jgi:hypothetical protein